MEEQRFAVRWLIAGLGGVCLTLAPACQGDLRVNPAVAYVDGGSAAGKPPAGGKGDEGGGSVGAACTTNADCADPLRCELASHRCVPPDKCGAFEVRAESVPANLLIVLDRSCSMNGGVGATMKSKWQIAVAALDTLLTNYAGKLRFGLTLFPDRAGAPCTQEAIPFPLAAQNEGKIKATLQASLALGDPNFPSGPCVTNIDAAMQQAAGDPALGDPSRPSFVLLLSDGAQFCPFGLGGDAVTTATIADLHKKNVGTFVVGFGSSVDPLALDTFASAGGKPNSAAGGHKYYQADDQTTLDQALAAIAAKALGCSFSLASLPSTLAEIQVFFDGKEIAKDASKQEGWDFDAKSKKVTFYGKACQKLGEGGVQDLDFVYGCRDPAPTCPGNAASCEKSADCAAGHGCVVGCCVKVID